MGAVRLRTVLGIGHHRESLGDPHMRGHAAAAMEDLKGGRRCAQLHRFAYQRVGNTVEAALKNHVVIDVHRGSRPYRQIETGGVAVVPVIACPRAIRGDPSRLKSIMSKKKEFSTD